MSNQKRIEIPMNIPDLNQAIARNDQVKAIRLNNIAGIAQKLFVEQFDMRNDITAEFMDKCVLIATIAFDRLDKNISDLKEGK